MKPEDFRDPTELERARFPTLPEGVAEPEGEAVAYSEGEEPAGGLVRAVWWGDGSAPRPHNVGVQFIPPEGRPLRAPTLEEMHAAVSAVALEGAVFNVPGLAAGLPVMDPDRPVPALFILVQMTAVPGTRAARRLQLTAPNGAPNDGREGSPRIVPGR